jgi:hypothetical protein
LHLQKIVLVLLHNNLLKQKLLVMKKLENYAEAPFDGIGTGRDKTVEFFTDHVNRLTQAIANGEPFSVLLPPVTLALTNLSASKTATAVNIAQQGSQTMTVNNYIQQFKDEVTKLEPRVLIQFPKHTTEYHEFFPQGKTAYSSITKGNIDNLFATIITACQGHIDKLGTEPAELFIALRTNYQTARNNQLQKKGNTDSTRSAWDDNLDTMKDMAFHNLLMIADAYRGQPEKIGMFFDQSIITPLKHAQPEIVPPAPI